LCPQRLGIMKNRLMIQSFWSSVFLLAVLVQVPCFGQTLVESNYAWNTPAGGSPVHHYIVEISVNDGPWVEIGTSPEPVFTYQSQVGEVVRLRVAGVDEQGRQGPFSDPSPSYTIGIVDGPGQPGQPALKPK